MTLSSLKSFVLTIATSTALLAAPDAKDIIKRSVQANDADWKAAPQYSYLEADSVAGKLKKTVEIVMIDGSPYQKVVALNGVPLSADRKRQEDSKLQAEISRRQRESSASRARRIGKYTRGRQDDHLLMQQMINAFDFKLVGEEKFAGHDSYVLEATPRPGYKPINEKAKVLTGMKGKLWVDKTGYHWVKVQADVIKPVNVGFGIAKVGPGTRFELEQAPVDGNRWLPKRFVEVVNAKVVGFKHRSNIEEVYSNYRRADLQANLVKH